MQKPYTPFAPAIDNFYGRSDICLDFSSRVFKLKGKKHLLISGYGGIGKTSLLLRLLRVCFELQEFPIENVVYIDIGRYTSAPLRIVELMLAALPRPEKIADRLLVNFKNHFGLPPTATNAALGLEVIFSIVEGVEIGFPPSWSVGPLLSGRPISTLKTLDDGFKYYRQELERVMSERAKPVVVFLDQFGKLAEDIMEREREAFLHHMEAILKATNESNVLMVLAVRPERMGKLEHACPTIFQSDYIDHIPLNPLDEAEAKALIQEPAKAAGVQFSSQVVNTLYDSSGGDPYDLQLTCSLLWEHLEAENLLKDTIVSISPSEVRKIIQGQLEDRIWDKLTDKQQAILKIIALNEPISEVQIQRIASRDGLTEGVSETLEQLRQSGFRPIRLAERNVYSIGHELFRDYIVRVRCGLEELEISTLRNRLNSATRMYESYGEVLSKDILDSIWQYRYQLGITKQQFRVIIESELADPNPELNRWVVWHGQWAVKPLVGALKDPRRQVRKEAVLALGQIGDEQAIKPLVEALWDRSWEIREQVADALVHFGERVVEPVVWALESQREEVRWAAIKVLGQIRDPRAVKPLIKMLKDRRSIINARAIWALAQIGKPAVDPLVTALEDEDWLVRQSAAKALRRIGDERALKTLAQSTSRPTNLRER